MRGLRVVAVAAAASGAFAAGRWSAHREPTAREEPSGRRILYYYDPMHPSYRSRSPGVAPDCGMKLEPAFADDAPDAPDAPVPSGTVTVPAERQQAMGLRFGTVERGRGTRSVRTIGRVVPVETRVHRVALGVEGWVSRVEGGASTGSFVRRGQRLASVASRDILSPQQAYVYALESRDALGEEPANEQQLALVDSQLAQARQALEAVGMGSPQIRELERTRAPAAELQIDSPVDGIVLLRNADPGQRYDRLGELFRIASIDRVWVLADLSPEDADLLRPGTPAEVGLPGQARVRAQASAALPQFDAGSRTFKARLEADNPRARLRPDMLLDVDLELALPEAVVVDRDAVVDSGERQTVFVDRGGGRLEPRQVRTGWRTADRVEIVEGATPGERVVVSGVFLLDADVRLRDAVASPSAERAVDPSCGMPIEPARAAAVRDSDGRRYYFCSKECLRRFEARLGRYSK